LKVMVSVTYVQLLLIKHSFFGDSTKNLKYFLWKVSREGY